MVSISGLSAVRLRRSLVTTCSKVVPMPDGVVHSVGYVQNIKGIRSSCVCSSLSWLIPFVAFGR